MNPIIIEEKGKIYGYWQVLGFSHVDRHHNAVFKCLCLKCGNVKLVRGFTLRNGSSTKCKNCAIEERKEVKKINGKVV